MTNMSILNLKFSDRGCDLSFQLNFHPVQNSMHTKLLRNACAVHLSIFCFLQTVDGRCDQSRSAHKVLLIIECKHSFTPTTWFKGPNSLSSRRAEPKGPQRAERSFGTFQYLYILCQNIHTTIRRIMAVIEHERTHRLKYKTCHNLSLLRIIIRKLTCTFVSSYVLEYKRLTVGE